MSVKQTVENVYIRQNAMQLTRRFFWSLLGITVVVNLANSGLDHLLTLLGDTLLAAEIQAAANQAGQLTTAQKLMSYDPTLDAILRLFTSPKYLLYNLLYIVITSLVSCGLSVGKLKQFIATGRGGVPGVAGVFRQMPLCLKAWGLTLWMDLKILLWALPGAAVFFAGAELQAVSLDYSSLGSLLGWAGLLLIIILVVRAMLNYSQAFHLLADEPDRTIRSYVTCSKDLMKGRKWQFFKVGIPSFLKAAGIFLSVYITIGLVLHAAGYSENATAMQILDMFAIIAAAYFHVQLDMVYALYYLKLHDHPVVASIDSPAESLPAELPENNVPITNDEAKENDHEQPDC